MKILLVSHTFFPDFIGGTESYVLGLAETYIKLKHEVLILTSNPLSKKNDYSLIKDKYLDVDVIRINKNIRQYSKFEQTYIDPLVDEKFLEVIDDFKPDVVHFHHLMHLSLDIVKITKEKSIPCVYTIHDYWSQNSCHKRVDFSNQLMEANDINSETKYLIQLLNKGPTTPTPISWQKFIESQNKPNYLKTAIEKIITRLLTPTAEIQNFHKYKKMVIFRKKYFKQMFSQIDLVVFPSLFLFQEYSKWGINVKNYIISDNGINLTSNIQKLSIKTKQKHINFAYIGAIIEEKGLDVLLKSWQQIYNITQNTSKLKIYGDYSVDYQYTKRIKNQIKNMKNVKLLGKFDRKDIASIFSNIDVLIVPSRWHENAPMVIREAQTFKIPTIVSRMGGMPESITHGVNGYIFENGDYLGLSTIIEKLIENKNLISQLSQNILPPKSIFEDAKNTINLYETFL
jgi:glycosyltransferase involved in cell wall biosynthesis